MMNNLDSYKDNLPLTNEDLGIFESMVRVGDLKLFYRGEEVSGLLRLVNECWRLNKLREKGIDTDAIE